MQMGNFLFVLFDVESRHLQFFWWINAATNIRDAHRFLVCHETHHAMHGWAHTFFIISFLGFVWESRTLYSFLHRAVFVVVV
jgi:hypothetical protein